MPKTAVKTEICHICGAEVRDGSLFCYNCGGSLQQAVDVPEDEPVISENARTASTPAKPSIEEKRAARRRKNVERGPVEVVWEPRDGMSVPFVISASVLLLLAIALFVAAMWLK